ncbi:MAG TPA: thioredoxin family protein [Burkholderiaceae bacterium]|jgi:protein disulfide-isomerase|nr:thioredoxin family protein [Burkholderiaceae bacterium]
MKRLACTLALVLAAGFATAASGPYDPSADAKAEIQSAMTQAATAKEPVLLIFGANWCADCRALDKSLKTARNAELISQQFKVVKVDVGNFDHNLDVAAKYGDPIKKGIPAAVIVSPAGQVIYATKGGELADARRMSDDGVYEFFRKAVADARPTASN